MSARFSSLPRRCRVYVISVSAIGLLIAGQSLLQLHTQQVSYEWLTLAALTLLTGTFTVRIPGIPARLSVSDTFVFASALLFGPVAGTITALLDALIISLRLRHHTREPFRVIFNVSVASLSTWVAAHLFFLSSAILPYSVQYTPLGEVLFPLLLFTLVYFLLNSWLVTFALALERSQSPLPIWRHNFLWLSVNYFGGASVAGLLVAYTRGIDLTTLGVIVPLLCISYLTFKTSLGRIEDANRHLTEVNQHYLSTIETLAMAIDAKDQVTHGHIRRVQRYAVGLARALGIKDEPQIRAIEAAALLHDMGKLAIPEFILNKPGRLTPSEFEIMKKHTTIGAGILSAIKFPYPVVPIVRHHHENWNGGGYPDQLKGTSIPIGARILSVVDCFDALTSDRPYRGKLSTADALEVLLSRRTTMYDPLVVDTFVAVQEHLTEEALSDSTPDEKLATLSTLLGLPQEQPLLTGNEAPSPAPSTALRLLQEVSQYPLGLSMAPLGAALWQNLSELASVRTLVIFVPATGRESVVCCHSSGKGRHLFSDVEFPLGERITGWVAAHRTPIWNSDAALDLAGHAPAAEGLSKCSSFPLMLDGALVGVISLYGDSDHEIGLEHRFFLQALGPTLAQVVSGRLGDTREVLIRADNDATREAVFAVLEPLLSQGVRADRPSNEGASVTVRFAAFPVHPDRPIRSGGDPGGLMIVEHALISIASKIGFVIRLSEAALLIVTGPLVSPSHIAINPGVSLDDALGTAKRMGVTVRDVPSALELRRILKEPSGHRESQPDRPGNRIH